MPYTVDAGDTTQPSEDKGAIQGAEELRLLKEALIHRSFFSVTERRFQVVGAATDRQAINNCVDAAYNARAGATVWFPGRNTGFKTDEPLIIARGMNVLGEHPYYSTICGMGFSATEHVIDVTAAAAATMEWVRVGNLCLMTDGNTGNCIRINNASNSKFGPLNLRNGIRGMVITGTRTFSNVFEQITATATLTGGTIFYVDFQGGGNHTFNGGSVGGGIGMFINGTSSIAGLAVNGMNFEACANVALRVDGDIWGGAFVAPRTEKCAGSITFLINPNPGHQVQGLSILGGFFETDGETDCIYIGGQPGGSVDGFQIMGNTARDYANNFVYIGGQLTGGIIAGNNIVGGANPVNAWAEGVWTFNNSVDGVISPPFVKNFTTIAPPDYTVTNPATRRTLDVSTASLAELREAVGTLMQDFVDVGFLR